MSLNHALTCQEISSVEGFENLRELWEEIFASCSYPTVFCAWEWAWLWWQNFGTADPLTHNLLILTVTDSSGSIVAIAPFCYPTQTGKSGLLPPLRPLRPLGTRLRCQMEDMTEEPILLLRQGFEEAALQAVLLHLRHRQSCGWDLSHVRAVRGQETANLSTLWKRNRASWARTHYRCDAGQLVVLPDSWPAFTASLSRSMRGNIVYYPRRLSRDGHAWAVRTARSPDEIAAAVDTLIALHHRRSRSDTGVPHRDHIPGQRFESFFREVMVALAAQGRAAIVVLEIDGVAIAAQAILEHGSMLTFYYSGFDPAWHSYSPVTVLNLHIIRDAIARGLSLVNYLPTSALWKSRWGTTEPYVVDEISWIAMRPRSIVAALRRSWKRRLKSQCECGFCDLPLYAIEGSDSRSHSAGLRNAVVESPL